ncbi:MAG: D-alanyl-D-alanine carboxypeptidase family protein [Pseudoflavonifractor sp.]
MKRMLAGFLAVFFLIIGTAQAAPGLSAASAILVDGETGRVLFAQNAEERRPIASITKLMTALVAVRSAADLAEIVTVTREDTLTEGSSMYLTVGEEVSLEALLYGLLLVSGNDAARCIARHCAGDIDTFVAWMNRCAADLGMENTHFEDPNGLTDAGHYSTAGDMAVLARAVMGEEILRKIVSTKAITLETRSMTNHNKLLWRYEGCLGMKTGYTDKAGRTLVSCAERQGQLLIAVTLHAPDDWRDHAALLDYGFDHWRRSLLALQGRYFRCIPVGGSLLRVARVITASDVYYPLAEAEQVRAEVSLPDRVEAPVKAGAIAGSLDFYLGKTKIGSTYLLYAQDVRSDKPVHLGLMDRVLEFLNRGKAEEMIAAFYCRVRE